jgi:hypothetical protein
MLDTLNSGGNGIVCRVLSVSLTLTIATYCCENFCESHFCYDKYNENSLFSLICTLETVSISDTFLADIWNNQI